MRDLIAELKERRNIGSLVSDEQLFKGNFQSLSVEELHIAESDLGFALTPTLRRIYTEVANGGFGPQYGLLGLRGGMLNEDGNDAIAQYKLYRQPDPEDSYWSWPDGLLPLGHLGCAMYLCVDCTKDSGPVTWFEPNPHCLGQSWSDAFIPFAESTDNWLLAWLDGQDLFDKLVNQVLFCNCNTTIS
ncbi:MAG: SMI1/KNR4 family protein [Xenococcaceae cyanobacterium]